MKRFNNIMCVVEQGAGHKPALERAVTLAENNQANLTVIAVAKRVAAGIGTPEGGSISADLQAALVSAHEQNLESLIEPYRQRINVQAGVLIGTPFLEIIREVMRNGRDLLIKSAETWDWQERLFGSDDMHLLRKCPCPVWLIKPEALKAYRRILVAVDVDDVFPSREMELRRALNLQLLEMAGSLALAEFAELHIVHAWDAIGESIMHSVFMKMSEDEIAAHVEQERLHHAANLDNLIDEVAGQDALDYLKPQTHLVKGWARKEIPALAKQIEADIVVMGTVVRTGIPGFIMGNTAETIMNQIDCSVLAIKPPDFVTPVTQQD